MNVTRIKLNPFILALVFSPSLYLHPIAKADVCNEELGGNPSEAALRSETDDDRRIELLKIIDDSQSVYKKMNETMAAKYSKLSTILIDPKKYKGEMEARFNQMKLISADPYRFDFSDHAKFELEYMRDAIPIKLEELEKLRAGFKNQKKIKDYSIVIQYLQEVKNEITSYFHEDGVHIDYRSFIEISYFFSRAIGLLDSSRFPLHVRLFLKIDRSIDGYQEYSPEIEYQLYHERVVNLFPEKSSVQGFEDAAAVFRKVMWNPDRLELLMLPTHVSFNRDIFYRMMPFELHFLGMIKNPLLSEGFLRPGGDFIVHDARHESSRVKDWLLYVLKHTLNPLQEEALKAQIDIWIDELVTALETIPDQNLREAIVFMNFNLHHDQGTPVLPSFYGPKMTNITPFALYTMMKAGGQKVDFKWGYYYLPKAYRWLKKFWDPKLPLEMKIIKPFSTPSADS